MLVVTTEACRVSRGLVLWVCASGVRNHCYQPAPEGLLYEWWKRGGQCWRPAYWYRSGIPGSGGQHWLRADVEYVLSFLGPDRRPRRGRPATHGCSKAFGLTGDVEHGLGGQLKKRQGKYPAPRQNDHGEPAPDDPNSFWTDNTAMGRSPKRTEPRKGDYDVRKSDGIVKCDGTRKIPVVANPGNLIETEPEDDGVWTDNTAMRHEPKASIGGMNRSVDNHRTKGGERLLRKITPAPALVNPGNLIETNSGYGSMGSSHAHDNEAPFPEALAEFFIKTACKPGGIVLDPFSGSGTTVAVAERLGRIGIGLDIRRSQAELAERRITRPHSERKRTGRLEKDMPLFS